MLIKKLKIKNFKSFKNLEIELGNFNIFIGANASGKSNFVKIFEFIRDITRVGLDNAVSMQGSIEYLRNITNSSDEVISIGIIFEEGSFLYKVDSSPVGLLINKITYDFALRQKETEYEIIKEELSLYCDFVKGGTKNNKLDGEKIGEGKILIFQDNGKINSQFIDFDNIPLKEDDLFPKEYLSRITFSTKFSILEVHPLLGFLSFASNTLLSEISIYDFAPKLSKQAISIIGKAELEEDGKNLAIVLKNILANQEKRRKFINLIRDLLPFIGNLEIKKVTNNSLLFTLQEKYTKEHYLPSSFISDGTINIIALIIALYFSKQGLTIIEEPERNIHPHLISRLVNMMKDASKNKQIIVTTHNPEIIKHADINDIYLVSRDKDGFSVITKPSEKEEVKIFLKNEMGIDELYVQNLLEI